MSDYETKPCEDVNNPQYKFYKLYVDGVCQFDQFLDDISKNVADSKLYSYIIAYMDNLTDGNRFPSTKFNHIEDSRRNDLFEFKKDRLRVYVIKQKPDIYIVVGGFKGSQKKDIKLLKSLIKDFPKEDAI